MNNQRRKELDKLIAEIEALGETASNIRERLEAIRDDEQEYIDNMPESLQSSERYFNAENAVSQMEEAIGYLEELDVDNIVTLLNEAQE